MCNVRNHSRDISKMKKKQYDPDALKEAYNAVQKGKSVYRAAREYGVPESTLRDRTLGLVSVDGRCANFLFADETEKQIVDHVKNTASIGYEYSRLDVLYLATDLAAFLGLRKPEEDILSNHWYYSFIKRWPDLSVIKHQKLSMERAHYASKETLTNYYKDLGAIMTKYDLHDKPHMMYSIDESALQTVHNLKNVQDIVVKPQSVRSSRRSTNVTIIGAGNAVGDAVPPYYVFPGVKFDRSRLLGGTPAGSEGRCSKTGWVNSEVFRTYLEEHFLKHVNRDEAGAPLLILFDGHRAHVSLSLRDWAESQNIIIFMLPPHCSHILQPLDSGCFGAVKAYYSREAQLFMHRNPGSKITKFNIGQLSCSAYQQGLSAQNLTSSFRKSGIYPFNPVTDETSKLVPATIFSMAASDGAAEPIMNNVSEEMENTRPAQISDQNLARSDSTTQQIDIGKFQKENEIPLNDDLHGQPLPALPDVPSGIQRCTVDSASELDMSSCSSTVKSENRFVSEVGQKRFKRMYFKKSGHLRKKKMSHLNQSNKKVRYKLLGSKQAKKMDKQANESKRRAKNRAPGKRKGSPERVKTEKQMKLSGDAHSVDLNASGVKNDNGGPTCLHDRNDGELTDDVETCCVCNKESPTGISELARIVFVKWARCDNPNCRHWTHLKFCSDIKVLKRGDVFFCPHCKNQ